MTTLPKIGCDIVAVSRIANSIKSDHFVERIFHEKEIEYCNSKIENSRAQSFAGRFAAKEAFVKALGTGFFGEGAIVPRDIWIENEKNGKPKLCFSDKVTKFLEEKNIRNWDVSLSHHEENAIAFVLLT